MSDRDITEKREHERKLTNVEVEIVSRGEVKKANAKDVSLSGIFIKNSEISSYDVGQNIVLAFESKAGKAHTVEDKIVRKDENGIGVRFKKELLDKAFEHARQWL